MDQDNNKNNSDPASPASENPPTGEQQHQSDLLFYNVMPKVKSVSSFVEPTLKIQEAEAQAAPPSAFSTNFKRFKIYIIFGIILIVGAPIAYYAATKLGNQGLEEEVLLINDTQTKNNGETDTQKSNENFTTPADWRENKFPGCTDENVCGDKADPDRDGLSNLEEYELETDPNNNDSDNDGLADGDEINVFGTNPLSAHTSSNQQYTDKDYFTGAYDIRTDKPLTTGQIQALKDKMISYGLHQPTVKSLGSVLLAIYQYENTETPVVPISTTTASSTLDTAIDQSTEAKQDRDAQRTATIKTVGIALIKYKADTGAFPTASGFRDMYDKIKPYLRVAINPLDPINKEPYVYGYSVSADGTDFTLSFYSETANQLIKKHAADALKDKTAEEAAMYDDQRETNLESLRTALLLYSNNNVSGNQDYVFPPVDKYKTALVPEYISVIPKDPRTQQDYLYQVSEAFNTFSLKAILDNPIPGTTGYLCNQEECREY